MLDTKRPQTLKELDKFSNWMNLWLIECNIKKNGFQKLQNFWVADALISLQKAFVVKLNF